MTLEIYQVHFGEICHKMFLYDCIRVSLLRAMSTLIYTYYYNTDHFMIIISIHLISSHEEGNKTISAASMQFVTSQGQHPYIQK